MKTAEQSPLLSRTMLAAHRHAMANGGRLRRFPGGFWMRPNAKGRGDGPYFGTSTIEALVARGVAEYTEWKEGRGGWFPVEVTVKPIEA
jgi:hypothetical protein